MSIPGPFSFGRKSERQLATVHHDLQIVLHRAIQWYDFSVHQGARTVEEQIRNIEKGVSKTLNSDHIPRDEDGRYDPQARAQAVDLLPYAPGVNPWPQPSDSEEVRQLKRHRFYFMQGVVLASACEDGIEIQQGVDWDRDADFFDQRFHDLPHVALVRDLPRLVVEGELLEMANEALEARGLPPHD